MNVIQIILEASLVVQLVMLILSLMSIYVWILIFSKIFQVRKLYRQEKSFYQAFSGKSDLRTLFKDLKDKEIKKLSPMESIFMDGFKEYAHLIQGDKSDIASFVHHIRGKMHSVYNQKMEVIEERSSMLATIGSSAPYIGLLGTVWGIIDAFHALQQIKHATLALIAPGISEALVATAMGLFVAIPAVIGYNRFQHASDRLANYYENFIEEFMRIIECQVRETSRKIEN